HADAQLRECARAGRLADHLREEPCVVATDDEARRLAAGETRIDIVRVARSLDGVDDADGAALRETLRDALLSGAKQRRLGAHADDGDLSFHITIREIGIGAMTNVDDRRRDAPVRRRAAWLWKRGLQDDVRRAGAERWVANEFDLP